MLTNLLLYPRSCKFCPLILWQWESSPSWTVHCWSLPGALSVYECACNGQCTWAVTSHFYNNQCDLVCALNFISPDWQNSSLLLLRRISYSINQLLRIVIEWIFWKKNSQSLVFHHTYLPVLTSQTDTVWSKDPVISWLPVVLKASEMISAEWPCTSKVPTNSLMCHYNMLVIKWFPNYKLPERNYYSKFDKWVKRGLSKEINKLVIQFWNYNCSCVRTL